MKNFLIYALFIFAFICGIKMPIGGMLDWVVSVICFIPVAMLVMQGIEHRDYFTEIKSILREAREILQELKDEADEY